ncbi:uncharacterized protein PHACADRAFT_200104 [Phanerochaete carnosa HHB-10118-sp]|uniref:Uncharacterized protein n=1 Tax=Phanerochaete carnosa (strain HHB-10118-sp) TaxID=650164 RepID=K5VXH7_PHACS|nr:uncharacterized protein PHACADRAFT_200104 [Phanerochaete carnosa HHB-10118-sp]EKM51284.1 hypothetical protein PHACADRAFT_200104 [Phanerochaete carnosa HHB-10118-sp]
MARLSSILTFAVLAATSSAAHVLRDTSSGCTNPGVVSNQTLSLNGVDIQWTTLSCAVAAQPGENFIFPIPLPFPFFPPSPKPKPTTTVVSTPTAPPPVPTTDVCNQVCTDACGSLGDLPPISEDCQQIFNSITILNSSISPNFVVNSSSIEQLTFGTCRVFFENFSNGTMSECWTTLSNAAEAAGTLCFPPTQPVNSAAFCSPADGSWQIGIAHS